MVFVCGPRDSSGTTPWLLCGFTAMTPYFSADSWVNQFPGPHLMCECIVVESCLGSLHGWSREMSTEIIIVVSLLCCKMLHPHLSTSVLVPLRMQALVSHNLWTCVDLFLLQTKDHLQNDYYQSEIFGVKWGPLFLLQTVLTFLQLYCVPLIRFRGLV